MPEAANPEHIDLIEQQVGKGPVNAFQIVPDYYAMDIEVSHIGTYESPRALPQVTSVNPIGESSALTTMSDVQGHVLIDSAEKAGRIEESVLNTLRNRFRFPANP